MPSKFIMILADQNPLSETIQNYLTIQGYKISGIARSPEEAHYLSKNQSADIWLIDMGMPRTSLTFARFLRNQANPKPFIFLGSQSDTERFQEAKETLPTAFISLPIHKESLYANMEIALHVHQKPSERPLLKISEKGRHFFIPLKDIIYVQADHVYVRVHIHRKRPILKRCPMKEIAGHLPEHQFIQTHRSYIVNKDWISHWDNQSAYVNNSIIPISRSQKKKVHNFLKMEDFHSFRTIS